MLNLKRFLKNSDYIYRNEIIEKKVIPMLLHILIFFEVVVILWFVSSAILMAIINNKKNAPIYYPSKRAYKKYNQLPINTADTEDIVSNHSPYKKPKRIYV